MIQFYVGQEVVCVNARQPTNTTLQSELVDGSVYKVRWIGIHQHYLDGEYVGVRLEGLDRGTCQIWGDVDTPFRADRFRPVVRDRLAVLRSIAAGGPLVPSIEEPRRKVPAERAKEDVE